MYKIVWLQAAVDELTAAWLRGGAVERRALTSAAHQVDRLLERDPEEQGESRERSKRVLFVPPLGISFDVDGTASLVRVLHVWDIRRNP